MEKKNGRCTFNEENRMHVIRALGYYRMRVQDRLHPLTEWEIRDLVETLEVIEGSLLKVWPLLMEIAEQPFLEGGGL